MAATAPVDYPTPPATSTETLATNAALRQQLALREREHEELWRALRNGMLAPQCRTEWAAMLRALYRQRDRAGTTVFTADYYQLALEAGLFARPRSDDAALRKIATKRAKDRAGRILRQLHDADFLVRGRPTRTRMLDGTVVTDGVPIRLAHPDLLGALHDLGTYDQGIPERKPRGPQAPAVRCGHCGSFNVTYDCHTCGAVNRPAAELSVEFVPAEGAPTVSQTMRVSNKESQSQTMRDGVRT